MNEALRKNATTYTSNDRVTGALRLTILESKLTSPF